MTVKKRITKRNYWKEEEEGLLRQWADKSQCYQWMHTKAREIYQRKNAMYTIPVIILSTITGTANFAQERFSDENKPYVAIAVGSLSIIAGIITTVYQFLKISELNESHRVASISWGKFYRDINAELIRHPLDRIPPDQFMKHCKEEYSRLVEISPFIPKKILARFTSKFKKNKDLAKPEIGDELIATGIYMMKPEERNNMVDELNKDVKISNKILENKMIKKQEKINKFKESFYEINRRYPTDEDLKKNIQYFEDEDNIFNKLDEINSDIESESDDNDSVISQDLEQGNNDNQNNDNQNNDNQNNDNQNNDNQNNDNQNNDNQNNDNLDNDNQDNDNLDNDNNDDNDDNDNKKSQETEI